MTRTDPVVVTIGWVYTPPGYPAACRAECDLIVAFDGATYLDTMELPRILDTRSPSTVNSGNRLHDVDARLT